MLPNQHFQQAPYEQAVVGVAGVGIATVDVRVKDPLYLTIDEETEGMGLCFAEQKWS